MAQIDFAEAKLLSDRVPNHLPQKLEWVQIDPLNSARAYSAFVLHHLADHVATPHCLLVQWDGHVIDVNGWQPQFLEYDFVGASWPHFADGYDVGNGGFSLRSRALLQACRDPAFRASHPEDLSIGRVNREWLERRGLRFPLRALADQFSSERAGDLNKTFGYHGVWHMPSVLGNDRFWQIYRQLDERTSVRHDFWSILWKIAGGNKGIRRAFDLTFDQVREGFTNAFDKVNNPSI
ncbi:MAG: DUF5672 family protein [Erythrobacter sp.]